MKSFEHWNIDTLEQTFGIQRMQNLPALQHWLAEAAAREQRITPEEHTSLLKIQEFLRANADYWNEQELQIYFIGPLLLAVNFQEYGCTSFFQRKLSVNIHGEKLGGTVDCIIATGRVEPQKPLFMLQEYKRERGRNNDPLGQLLAAMFAASIINANNRTVYGCYVIGRYWYFVVLNEKEYAVSDGFIATQHDVFMIFALLRQMRSYVGEWLQALAGLAI
jgi:hypothetical protein